MLLLKKQQFRKLDQKYNNKFVKPPLIQHKTSLKIDKNIDVRLKKQGEIHFFLVKMQKIACVIGFNYYIAPPKQY